jgi:hypothetical protein
MTFSCHLSARFRDPESTITVSRRTLARPQPSIGSQLAELSASHAYTLMAAFACCVEEPVLLVRLGAEHQAYRRAVAGRRGSGP